MGRLRMLICARPRSLRLLTKGRFARFFKGDFSPCSSLLSYARALNQSGILSRGTSALSFDWDSADTPALVVGLSSEASPELGDAPAAGAATTGARSCWAGAVSSRPGWPPGAGFSGSDLADAARGLVSWPLPSCP